MAGLSAAQENRILLLGIGLAAGAIVGIMRHMLIVYRDSVEIKSPPPKTQYITQGTEDSLKQNTLEKLVDSHNYGIQETATRIVCDRAVHDNVTLDIVLRELSRPEHGRREQAIRALNMLSQTPGASTLNSTKVWNAIVKCLTYCVNDVPHEPYDREFDNFEFREPVERLCLAVISRLMYEFGSTPLISSGFIEEWLAKEPWGDTQEERDRNFADCCLRVSKLSDILVGIARNRKGLERLHKSKLYPTPTQLKLFDDVIDVRMINGEGTAGERGSESNQDLRPRIREHSAEERHLRRRHREAMVLNDGTAPIASSDIIELPWSPSTEERRPTI